MKSKKTLMGMVLLIGVLVLGIGYAAISTVTLNINGSASASADGTFIVEFESAPAADTDKGGYLESASISEKVKDSGVFDVASFTVSGMKAKNDSQTIVFPITSEMEADLQAALAVGTITNSNTEYFNVTAEITGEKTLNATTKASAVTVTVTLIKTPLTTEATANITVPLTATPSVVTTGTTENGS